MYKDDFKTIICHHVVCNTTFSVVAQPLLLLGPITVGCWVREGPMLREDRQADFKSSPFSF